MFPESILVILWELNANGEIETNVWGEVLFIVWEGSERELKVVEEGIEIGVRRCEVCRA